jgi:Skp family chaperone for outer membrane proteins
VRKSHLLVALAASLLAASALSITLIGSRAAAQQTAPAAVRSARGGPVVALVDISYIFKNHRRFKKSMDDMKAAVQQAEAGVKMDREAILRLAEQLKDFRKGTPDYNSIDEDLTTRRTKLGIRVQKQKKEFLQTEARIYYNVYQEVLQEVNYYCTSNRVTMVLRFSGDRVDIEDPESVLTFINKPVIWYAKECDITPWILDRLNRDSLNPGMRTGHAPTRPGVPLNRGPLR